MGIHQLTKVIGDHAPNAVKTNEIKNYFGRKVAIDASMSIYQFLIAVRQQEGSNLTNDEGETTSHLMGLFYRTIRMIEQGIKPVYVFDGKPPELKGGELGKRAERREEAQKVLEKAEEEEDRENIEKMTKRLVKVTPQHNQDCMQLLQFMGVPHIEAPSEAEAQCAELVRSGKVYATGTEDMDALTFGAGVLLRHLTFSEARKMPIQEFYLERILSDMGLDMDQFIDLCILLGCDYCESIRGIGPKKAVELIRKHSNIEAVLEHLDTTKYPVPEDWKFREARELFKKPEVTSGDKIELKWSEPDEEGLVKFMCEKNGFSEERIRNATKKLFKARQSTTQGRIDSFFTITPGTSNKRKSTGASKGPEKKKGKAGAFKKPK